MACLMQLAAAIVVFGVSVAAAQKIDSISPKAGSITGGTRLSILGSGFDARGRSNDVYIGTSDKGVFCDPVPNECHDKRIVCLTPAFEGRGEFKLQVKSLGAVATCGVSSGCTFTYTMDNTPTITGVSPQWITTPSDITVLGKGFDRGDQTVASFDFSAWLGDEERCDLGSNAVAYGSFVCSAHSGIFPGRNPLKVQLGSRGNAVGKAEVMVFPQISGVSASQGSTEGGLEVTIYGTSFSRTLTENVVSIHGTSCTPTRVTEAYIVCTTGPHVATTTKTVTYAPGVALEWWSGGIASGSIASVRASLAFLSPNAISTVANFGGVPDQPTQDNCAARYTAYFKPTVSGNYTFKVAGDDFAELWLSTDSNPVEYKRQSVVDDLPFNERLVAFNTKYASSLNTDPSTQHSAPQTLVAGNYYWMQVTVGNGVGGFGVTVGIEGPNGQLDVNPSQNVFTAPQWVPPVQVVSRGVRALYAHACLVDNGCNFNYVETKTSTVTAVLPASPVAGDTITISGTGFPAGALTRVSVTIGRNASCAVTSVSATSITCKLADTTPAGIAAVAVVITGSGKASGNTVLNVKFAVTSATNADGILVVRGKGLNVDPVLIAVRVGTFGACTAIKIIEDGAAIACIPPASAPTGNTQAVVSIKKALRAVATKNAVMDEKLVRPGTTTVPLPPSIDRTTGDVLGQYRITITVPAWVVSEVAEVKASLGELDCPVIAAMGSTIICVAPAVSATGTFAVSISRNGAPAIKVGSIDISERVTSADLPYLSTLGGNVVNIAYTSVSNDDPVITYRGVPCASIVKSSATAARCFLSDASITAPVTLPVLASFASTAANALLPFQKSTDVRITPGGFYIPKGGFLFTRQSYSTTLRVSADVTATAADSCLTMSVRTADPSLTNGGISVYSKSGRFYVAREGWAPNNGKESPSGVTAAPGQKMRWVAEVGSRFTAFYVDGELVTYWDAPYSGSGFVGFPPMCQDVIVDNLKIEDLRKGSLEMTLGGRAVTMTGEPMLLTGFTPLQVRAMPTQVASGASIITTLSTYASFDVYLFPDDGLQTADTAHQLTSASLSLCTSRPSVVSKLLDGTTYARCTVSTTIPSGKYIARILATGFGFRPERFSLTVVPSVTAIKPANPSYYGGYITVVGTGFSGLAADFEVTAGNKPCVITVVSYTTVECEIEGAASATALGPFAVTVRFKDVQLEPVAPLTYTYKTAAQSPTITSATRDANTGNVILAGTGLSTSVILTIESYLCTYIWGTATSSVCRFRRADPPTGSYAFRFLVKGVGFADTSSVRLVIASASIDAVVPNTIATAATAAVVTITGTQLPATDDTFTSVAGFNFIGGALEPAGTWEIENGSPASYHCGDSGREFGGFANFDRRTVARRVVRSLPQHGAVSVTFSVMLHGMEWLEQFSVSIGGKVFLYDWQHMECEGRTGSGTRCGDSTRVDCLLEKTITVPHSDSVLAVEFRGIPAWSATARSWGIRAYNIQYGAAIPLTATIGSVPCDVASLSPRALVCALRGPVAAGQQPAAVLFGGQEPLPCTTATCAVVASAARSPTVLAATFAAIPAVSTGASIAWTAPVGTGITTVNGPAASATIDASANPSSNMGVSVQQRFYKADGFRGVSFTLAGGAVAGLSSGEDRGASYSDIDFGMMLYNGGFVVTENGEYVQTFKGGANTVCSIRVEDDDTVSFLADTTVVMRSTRKIASWPLRLDVTFISRSSSVANLKALFAATPAAPAALVPIAVFGANLNDTERAAVTVGGIPCPRLARKDGMIVCALPAASATLGTSLSVVATSDSGRTAATTVVLAPAVTGVSAASGPIAGFHRLTIVGGGFSAAPTVTIGAEPCAVESFTFAQIVCRTAPVAGPATGILRVVVNSVEAACPSENRVESKPTAAVSIGCPSYSFVAPSSTAPTVSSIAVVSGQLVATGTNFPTTAADKAATVIYLRDSVPLCTVTALTATSASCDIAKSRVPSGAYTAARVLFASAAGSTNAVAVAVPLTVTITPTQLGVTGGAVLSIQSSGFGNLQTIAVTNAATQAPICATLTMVDPTDAAKGFTCVTSAGAFSSVQVTSGSGASVAVSVTAAASFNPTITAATPLVAGKQAVTITGTNFGAQTASVVVGGKPCTVARSSATEVVCIAASLPTGPVTAAILSGSNGKSNVFSGLTSVLAVDEVLPARVPAGAVVSVIGSGFDASQTFSINIGDLPCANPSVQNEGVITCTAQGPADFRDETFAVEVEAIEATAAVDASVTYAHKALVAPTVSAVTPATISKAGGALLTVTGTNFNVDPQKNRVLIGAATNCVVMSATETSIVCQADPIIGTVPSGAFAVSVTTGGIPSTVQGSITASMTVASISPNGGAISVEGGVSVTLTGTGFPAGGAQKGFEVTVGYTPCPVTASTTTQIICTAGASPRPYATSANLTNSYPMRPDNEAAVVRVKVNGSFADVNDATIRVAYRVSVTPVVSSTTVSSTPVATGTKITVTGTGFAATGNTIVLVQKGLASTQTPCAVDTESTTTIVCTVGPLTALGKHIVRVLVPGVGFAAAATACPAGEFLMCDGSCIKPSDCSVAIWGINADCNVLLSIMMGDTLCHSNGGSDRVDQTFVLDTGAIYDMNCPMYSCEGKDCNTTITIGGRGAVVSTCGKDPSGLIVNLAPKITAITGKAPSSLYGGLRLTLVGTSLGLSTVLRIGTAGAFCTPVEVTADGIVCETSVALAAATGLTLAAFGAGNVPAVCEASVCGGLSYAAFAASPVVGSVGPLRSDKTLVAVAGSPVTVIGVNFAVSAPLVYIGGKACPVTTATATTIECTAPALTVGDYSITVRVSGLGLSAPITTIARVRPTITALSSAVSSVKGGNTITVSGSALVGNTAAEYGFPGCANVVPVSASLTQLVIVTPVCATPTKLTVKIDGYTATSANVVFGASSTPSASAARSGNQVTVTSTLLPAAQSGVSAVVGNKPCVIAAYSQTSFTCDLPSVHAGGSFPLVVSVAGLGFANFATPLAVAFPGSVSDFTPKTGSNAGQQIVTVSGSGFETAAGLLEVTVAGVPCAVIAATATSVQCRTGLSATPDATGAVTVVNKAPAGSGTFSSAASYTFSTAATPTLTSVTPNRGSTAGGTRLTITGTRLSTALVVTINGVVCVQSASEQSQTVAAQGSAMFCTTGALPTSRGAVLSAVSDAHGAAANTLAYDYIDLWSRWTTWGNTAPPGEMDSAVISEGQTIMMDYNAPRLFLILVMGHLMFDDTRDVTLECTYVMINFGRMTIGTPEAPYTYQATIRLFGTRLTPEIPVHGAKVIALRHGALDFHGIKRQPTWTKLAATAEAGTQTIQVRGPVDWKAGEEIVITTTDFDMDHAEPRFIAAVANANTAVVTITLAKPLAFYHNGQRECFDSNKLCIEEVAEVMLLTRNIVIEGDERTQSLGFGGTMFLMPMGESQDRYARLSYVEFRDVGQQYIVGRYPVHYHVTHSSNNSFVKGCAVHRSLNRAFSIHGISNNTYVDNVVYDTHGHAFFIEDGSEKYNVIRNNLVAVARTSTSNLNTDVTPACFWIVSPLNYIDGNHAAGCGAYGFWISPFHPHSTGPTYSSSICPATHKMWHFENNVGHGAKKYGLNIFQFWWPKKKECDFNGPDEQATIRNHFTWKNRIHGVSVAHSEVGQVGSVIMDNLVSANNGEDHADSAAYWIEKVGAANMTVGVNNSYLIALTSNQPHRRSAARRGINLPLGDNFFSQNVTFVNYNNENFGYEPQAWAERMSFCFPWGWEAVSRGLRWVNSENRIRFRFDHHGLLNDDDGTLGGIAQSQVLPKTSLMDPQYCSEVAFKTGKKAYACRKEYKLRRFGVNGVSDIFEDQLFMVDDRKEIVPEIKHQYSMIIPMNRVVNIDFQWTKNPETWDWSMSPRFSDRQNERLIFQTLFKEPRDSVNATFGSWKPAMMNRRPEISDTKSGFFFEDKLYSVLIAFPQTGTKTVASTCPWNGCPIPPQSPAALGGPCKKFDDAMSWDMKQVPLTGEALNIKYTESICLDKPRTYRFKNLLLEGKLEVNNTFCAGNPNNKITLIVENYLHIRGGILQVGTNEQNFDGCKFEIIIGAVNYNDIGASQVNPWGQRGLVFESGIIDVHGQAKDKVAKLAATASAGSKTLTLDRQVNWAAGDIIAVAMTRRETMYTKSNERFEESEEAVVASVSGNTVQLVSGLRFEHAGRTPKTVNGKQFHIGAEVIALSRNVKISGGHRDGEVLPYGQGWNFFVGCTAKGTVGCAAGTDAMQIGFPMSDLKTGVLVMDSVQFEDIGQAGATFAALTMDGLVSRGMDLSAATSQVSRCAFRRVRNTAIDIRFSTTAMTLTDNVFFDVAGDGIRVASSGNLIDGNVVLRNTAFKPSCEFIYEVVSGASMMDCISGAFRIGSGNTVQNNIAASGDGAGFITVGEGCPLELKWAGNEAYRHRDGLLITDHISDEMWQWSYRDAEPFDCRTAGGVIAADNSDQGIAAWFVAGSLTVANVTLAQNMIGLSAIIFDRNTNDNGLKQNEFAVVDSTVIGRWPGEACNSALTFPCRKTLLDSQPWCKAVKHPEFTQPIGHVGLTEAVFVHAAHNSRTKGEHKFMWMENDNYATIKGRASIKNVHFDGFDGDNSCGHKEVAFFQNLFSNDTFHHHTFEGITWGSNVKPGGEFYAWSTYGTALGHETEGKVTTFLDFDNTKFGAYWPDAPNKVWLQDKDGSFTRTGVPSSVFASKSLVTKVPFTSIGYDGKALGKPQSELGPIKEGCTRIDKWNAYQCTQKQYISLSIESLAEDAMTRRAGPVVMCKGDGMIDERGWPLCQGGEVDIASGPVMKGKVQRATLDRMSRWRFNIENGHNYTLCFRGQPPVWLRMWLSNHEHTGLPLSAIGVVIHLRYFGQNAKNRVGIYVDGVRKPSTFGFGNPYWQPVPKTFPMPTDPPGTHYHDKLIENFIDRNIMIATVRPESVLDLKQEDVIIVTLDVSMYLEDFFANKDTFALALASVLGIDATRLKFAQIVPGTASQRRKLLAAGSSTSVTLDIELSNGTLSADASTMQIRDAPANDLPSIASRLNAAVGVPLENITGTITGLAAVDVSKVQVGAPAITVLGYLDYIVLNVTRSDGGVLNSDEIADAVANFINKTMLPQLVKETAEQTNARDGRRLSTEEMAAAKAMLHNITALSTIALGNFHIFREAGHSRFSLFFGFEKDATSNLITNRLFQHLRAGDAALILPTAHVVVGSEYVQREKPAAPAADADTAFSSTHVGIVVAGAAVLVALAAAIIGIVISRRRRVTREGLKMELNSHSEEAGPQSPFYDGRQIDAVPEESSARKQVWQEELENIHGDHTTLRFEDDGSDAGAPGLMRREGSNMGSFSGGGKRLARADTLGLDVMPQAAHAAAERYRAENHYLGTNAAAVGGSAAEDNTYSFNNNAAGRAPMTKKASVRRAVNVDELEI